jgi:hypothetical protein
MKTITLTLGALTVFLMAFTTNTMVTEKKKKIATFGTAGRAYRQCFEAFIIQRIRFNVSFDRRF